MVTTEGPATLTEFIGQRTRWASKNTRYGLANTLMLLIPWLFCLVLFVNAFTLTSIGLTLAAFMLILKVLVEQSFMDVISPFFNIRKSSRAQLLGQIYHIPYIVVTPFLSNIVRYSWKGRKLR